MTRFPVPQPHSWFMGSKAGIDGTSDRPAWARGPGAAGVLLLDRNENRDPELAAYIKGIIADLSSEAASDYGWPEPVYSKLASHLGVTSNQLMLAAGSEVSIRDVFATFVAPGDRILAPAPTYIMVPVFCRQFGATLVSCDYVASKDGPALDIELFCRMIADHRPRIVYLPNPNSPTGTAVPAPHLRQVIEAAGEIGALMLVDEAYYPFHDFTALPWLGEYPHLVVSRTFSKAWGMAGLRLGLLAAQQPLMAELHKVRPLNEAGALTLAVLDRLLDNTDRIAASVARLQDGKRLLCDEMRALGFPVYPGSGNFTLVDFREANDRVMAALEGVTVFRRVGHPSMAGQQRITSTTRAQFARLIDRIRRAVQA